MAGDIRVSSNYPQAAYSMNRPGPLGAQTKHDGRKGHGNAGGDNPQQASETTGPWQRLPKYGSPGAPGSESPSVARGIRDSTNFPPAAYSMDCPGPLPGP